MSHVIKFWTYTLTRLRSGHTPISVLSSTLIPSSLGHNNPHPYATLCDSVHPFPLCRLLPDTRNLTLPLTSNSHQPPLDLCPSNSYPLLDLPPSRSLNTCDLLPDDPTATPPFPIQF